VTWEEVERALKKKDANLLVFEAPQVVARVEKLGDLFEPVLELKQRLPDLKGAAKPPERIEIAAQAHEDPSPRKAKSPPKGPVRKKPGKV
jgi:bifunctional non-homologous end joining protein LigD